VTILSLFPIAALIVKAASGVSFAEVGRWVGGSLVNSLLGSGFAATIIVGIGAVLGHARARELKGARFLDLVGVLAFVAPAMLLGVGIIAIWNRPSTSLIYGGIGVIVIGYVARYSIVAIRTVAVAVSQSRLSLEHAAAAYGAGFTRRFVSIVLPMHKRTLAAAWLLAAVFCLRDLETAVIYYPPDWQPLTVRIFTLEANGPEAVVAGLAVVQVAVTMGLLAVGGLVIARRSGK
jgi:ABC-type Fe3+ transport system permease subunit